MTDTQTNRHTDRQTRRHTDTRTDSNKSLAMKRILSTWAPYESVLSRDAVTSHPAVRSQSSGPAVARGTQQTSGLRLVVPELFVRRLTLCLPSGAEHLGGRPCLPQACFGDFCADRRQDRSLPASTFLSVTEAR